MNINYRAGIVDNFLIFIRFNILIDLNTFLSKSLNKPYSKTKKFFLQKIKTLLSS